MAGCRARVPLIAHAATELQSSCAMLRRARRWVLNALYARGLGSLG